jgi:hypothetical protein
MLFREINKKGAIMNKGEKLLLELRAQDARGLRHAKSRPSQTSVVHRIGYISLLLTKIKQHDPEGKKAHEIATKL